MKPEKKPYKLTLSIDLGGKTTGVMLIGHPGDRFPVAQDCTAAAIVMPEDNDTFHYSTADRRAARHRLRGKKRFQMARRLLLMIVNNQLKAKSITLSHEEANRLKEALCGLLKRRGYSRVSGEIDLSLLENLDSIPFANHPEMSSFFYEGTPLAEQWEELSNRPDRVHEFLAKNPTNKDFKEYLKKEYPDLQDQSSDYEKGLSIMRDDANAIDLQINLGHKHRTQYLEDILADMARDSRLKPAVLAFGGLENLWRLVGNLSNLQLRAERWYFNAPYMCKEDVWQPERLQKTLVRAFKYFHPKPGLAGREMTKLITELEASTNIVDTLCRIDPVRTIPPYEDQNNRRPPLDQTLWLSPSSLNSLYGRTWTAWATSFERVDPTLSDNLDEILAHTDRRSRNAVLSKAPLPILNYKFSYILQRVLDRNSTRDPYALRSLTSSTSSQASLKGREALERTIGAQHVETFLMFARKYYAETADARSGLWLPRANNLLERADIHPPMKRKLLNCLVGNVFGLDEEFGRKFRASFWNRSIDGTSKTCLRTICNSIENTRKSISGEFNFLYGQVKVKLLQQQKLTKEENEIARVHERVERAAAFLLNVVKLDPDCVRRVANPYSLAQLYTLIETEINGFSSTSYAAQLENQWRMSNDSDRQKGAQCSRLPADSVRPFDGILRKNLDRQAYEMVNLVMAHLEESDLRDTPIDFAILVEQNKFAFSASLAEIKKNANSKSKDKLNKQIERQQVRWLSKEERIRQASQGICAYTGQSLGSEVEIDHIIPRSLTTSQMGTIFNSEANLICVSRLGNQSKQDQRYYLEDLNSKYLNKVFGTSDTKTIEKEIEDVVESLLNVGRLGYFEMLSEREQSCVRHALFLKDASEARNAVLRTLSALNRTKVNGTQSWLIRTFIEKLDRCSEDWRRKTGCEFVFRSWNTSAEEASLLRRELGKADPDLKKPEIQPVISHSIDALCAYAVACGMNSACNFMGGNPKFADFNTFNSPDSLTYLHPRACQVIHVAAKGIAKKDDINTKPIFKEGIYAEEFLPLIQCRNRLYVGFSLPNKNGENGNSIPVIGKNPFGILDILSDYLDKKPLNNHNSIRTYRIVPRKAYELFSRAALNPVSLSDKEKTAVLVLRSISFFTKRIPVESRLFDKTGKFVQKNEFIKDKDFIITINCNRQVSKEFSFKGKLVYPTKMDWMHLADDEKLNALWGNPNNENFNVNQWLAAKMNTNSAKVRHTSVKRTISLPIVSTTGTDFRIQRKSFDNTPVYQIYSIKTKGAGFEANGKTVNWKKPSLLPQLVHKNLTPLDFSMEESKSEGMVSMDEWRIVYDENDTKVFIAPGSIPRRYVKIEVPFSIFQSWLSEEDRKTIDSPMKITYKFKISKPLHADPSIAKIIGKPRDGAITVREVGNKLILFYSVDTSNVEMNQSYNKAGNRRI